MKILKVFGHIILIVLLTLITQVGGMIWLMSLILKKKYEFKKRISFQVIYLAFNFIIIPPIAKFSGREKLPINSKELKCISWFYPLTFRNYVTPELKNVLTNVSHLTGEQLIYLDANFPFFDGFPLLPHLSHNDGKKIDLAFYYKTKDNIKTNAQPSMLGYGAYIKNDNKTNNYCKKKGFWQYDITKYLNFRTRDNLKFDAIRNKNILNHLAKENGTEKLFIEPYIKKNLNLQRFSKIRFHGCHAVRHDDHIHIQVFKASFLVLKNTFKS